MRPPLSEWLLVSAGAAGMVVSGLMLLLARGPSRPRLAALCRMDAGTCSRVLGHPHARLLGVPNTVPGFLFYAGVAAAGFLGEEHVVTIMRVAAWIAVPVSVFLAWSLHRIVRARCPLCTTAHVLNIIIAVLFML